jgi:hypothetical protein
MVSPAPALKLPPTPLKSLTVRLGPTDRSINEGTLDQWAGQAAVDTHALSGHEYRTYRVDYALPIGASNLV